MSWLKIHFKKILVLFVLFLALILSIIFVGKTDGNKAEELLLPLEAELIENTLSTEETIATEETIKKDEAEPILNVQKEEIEITSKEIAETTEISAESTEEKISASTEEAKKTESVCTLTVKCDTILKKLDLLSETKRSVIPSDGIIYSGKELTFNDGESVFDILYKALKENNIHFEFSKSPAYGSVYIEGIGNLYEKDVGDLSGWMYIVNGEFPSTGSNNYKVKNGDNIVIAYSTNLGKDLK